MSYSSRNNLHSSAAATAAASSSTTNSPSITKSQRNVGPGFDDSTAAPSASELSLSFGSYYEAEKRASKRSQRNVDQKAARVQELVEFFQSPQSKNAPLASMVSFLAMRGFCRIEMEEALSECTNRSQEYSSLLSWVPGTELVSIEPPRDQHQKHRNLATNFPSVNAKSTTNLKNTTTNADGSNNNLEAASLGAIRSEKNNLDRTQQQQQQQQQLINKEGNASLVANWRVGGTVYVYLGDKRYAPIPLEILDLTRTGDILGVDHANILRFDPKVRRTLANPAAPLCCQGTGNLQHFAPGFKGIATNQCAAADIVHEGMMLLVADMSGQYVEMGTFSEATVLAVHIDEETVLDDVSLAASTTFNTLEVDSSDEDKTTNFTLDVEWARDGVRVNGINPNDTRLFAHAEVLRAEMRQRREQLRAARKGQKFSVDKVSSTANFPVSGTQLLDEQGANASGHALRAIKLNRQTRDRGATISVLPEHMTQGFVKNFTRFPELDSDLEPVHCRTAAEFVSHFGEAKKGEPNQQRQQQEGSGGAGGQQDSKRRRFPICPDSQKTNSGVGFGFDTSGYPRHIRSYSHLMLNPIVDVAFQCFRTNRKFIDPDFPPSFHSLFGTSNAKEVCSSNSTSNSFSLPPMYSRDPEQIENDVVWRRLSDIFFRPRMHVVDSSPSQLKLGVFTPPWLECVVLSLCRNPDMIEELVSPGEDGYLYGAYVVRMLVEGQWHFVLVDDFVPCHPKSGLPLCFLSGKESEIYTAIIEKALAKVEGSYASLYLSLRPEVTPGRIWNDLSGYVHEVIEHDFVSDKNNICENVIGLINEESLETAPLHCQARTYGDEVSHLVRFGFERDSWWHVDCAVRFWEPPNDPVYFFRVYRGENVGYSVSGHTLQAAVFDGLDTSILTDLPSVACDSPIYFWVDGSRFFEIFERTIILRELRNSHKAFFEGTFAGRPNAGPPSSCHSATISISSSSSSGGNNDNDQNTKNSKNNKNKKVSATATASGGRNFFNNPQLYFSVVQGADLIFHLELRDRRLFGGPGESEPLSKEIIGDGMQLYILHTHPVEEPITVEAAQKDPELYRAMAFSQPARVADDDDARAYPCVTLRTSLPGGCFMLIPTLGMPSSEEFTLSVYSTASFQVSRLN